MEETMDQYAGKIISQSLEQAKTDALKFKGQQRVTVYLKACGSGRFTLAGLARHLGVSTATAHKAAVTFGAQRGEGAWWYFG